MALQEALAILPGSTLVLVSIRNTRKTAWRGGSPIALSRLEGLVALFGGNPRAIRVQVA